MNKTPDDGQKDNCATHDDNELIMVSATILFVADDDSNGEWQGD